MRHRPLLLRNDRSVTPQLELHVDRAEEAARIRLVRQYILQDIVINLHIGFRGVSVEAGGVDVELERTLPFHGSVERGCAGAKGIKDEKTNQESAAHKLVSHDFNNNTLPTFSVKFCIINLLPR